MYSLFGCTLRLRSLIAAPRTHECVIKEPPKMATDWAAISKAVQTFYDTNGWWPSATEYDVIVASLAAPITPPAPKPSTPTPVSATIGSGSDSLFLKVSQDAYQGSAQYKVLVDGVQVGGTMTASALHGASQFDTITVKGNWAAGAHKV